ncbi:MAG: HAD-IA family hydrolase [Clostridia bacterium]|nr:HAD-IA family hydrolase [Clostridia bacterium]
MPIKILEKCYQCCIFDFDGVILDTEKYHYLAWRDVFAPFGIRLESKEYLPLKSTGRMHIINWVCQRYSLSLTEQEKINLADKKGKRYEHYATRISQQDLIGGVVTFLQQLRRTDCRIVIATSSMAAGRYIQKFALETYFDALYDGSLPLKKKPAPDLFLHIACEMGLSAGECIVFEDSLAGIVAAECAGMDVVAIGGIQAEKALLCIDDFSALAPEKMQGGR